MHCVALTLVRGPPGLNVEVENDLITVVSDSVISDGVREWGICEMPRTSRVRPCIYIYTCIWFDGKHLGPSLSTQSGIATENFPTMK